MKLNEERINTIYKVTDTHIHGFFNKHRYLSNFHLHSIEYEGIIYPSSENAYQAAKVLIGSEQPPIAIEGKLVPIVREHFLDLDPSGAKSLGRKVTLRNDWLFELPQADQLSDSQGVLILQVRDKIMLDLNRSKFQDPTLKAMLVSTDEKYLEETNWWKDDYWGTCNGTGLNKLGRILMKIRDEAKQKQKEAA